MPRDIAARVGIVSPAAGERTALLCWIETTTSLSEEPNTMTEDIIARQQADESLYVNQLLDLLRKAERGEWANLPKIAGWRFTASEGRSVTLSIVDNKLGDVYGPPTARDSLGGGIYIIWEDNKRTSTSIDRRTIPEFEERLQEWRASA